MKRKRVRGWRPRQTYVWGHERPGARLGRLRALLPLHDLEVDRAMRQLEAALERRRETREQIALIEAVAPGGRYSADLARSLAVRIDRDPPRRPVGRPRREVGSRALLKVEMTGPRSSASTAGPEHRACWSPPVVGPERVVDQV